MHPNLQHLARALAVRAISRVEQKIPIIGAGLVAIRADALTGTYDDHPVTKKAQSVYDEIMSLDVKDMPPETDFVSILLETASQAHDCIGWNQIWQSIGVNANTGRGYMSRNADDMTWPIWKTLRDFAFEIEQ